MTDADLPPEVRELVSRRIRSMEDVEVLLLLAGDTSPMTIDEIRAGLRIPESALPPSALEHLVAAELLATETETGFDAARYRFAPGSADLRRAVELLGVAYNERPVTLVRLVYHRPFPAQSFTDFRPNDDHR